MFVQGFAVRHGSAERTGNPPTPNGHGTCQRVTDREPSLSLSDFNVLEIVPGRNPLCLAERSVVEVHPSGGFGAVGQRHRDFRADVQAAVWMLGSVTLDFVERGKN